MLMVSGVFLLWRATAALATAEGESQCHHPKQNSSIALASTGGGSANSSLDEGRPDWPDLHAQALGSGSESGRLNKPWT